MNKPLGFAESTKRILFKPRGWDTRHDNLGAYQITQCYRVFNQLMTCGHMTFFTVPRILAHFEILLFTSKYFVSYLKLSRCFVWRSFALQEESFVVFQKRVLRKTILSDSKTEKLITGWKQFIQILAALRDNDYEVCRPYSTQGRQVKFIKISGRKTWWIHTVDLGEIVQY